MSFMCPYVLMNSSFIIVPSLAHYTMCCISIDKIYEHYFDHETANFHTLPQKKYVLHCLSYRIVSYRIVSLSLNSLSGYFRIRATPKILNSRDVLLEELERSAPVSTGSPLNQACEARLGLFGTALKRQLDEFPVCRTLGLAIHSFSAISCFSAVSCFSAARR